MKDVISESSQSRSTMPPELMGEHLGVAPFELPSLPYDYSDLEPIIDTETMKLHHDKHHRAYVDGLNKALEKYPDARGRSIEDILARINEFPSDIATTVHNMGGGHANHEFFWKVLSPRGGEGPKDELRQALESRFGDLDSFRKQFEEIGTKHFGSGWVLLVADPRTAGKLEIVSVHDQDTVIDLGKVALLSCDLWEHAYYLKYNNRRPDWLRSFWDVVNWNYVAEYFAKSRTQASRTQ